MLVIEVGDGDAVDQMAAEDGNLLDGRIVLAGLSHGETSADSFYKSGGAPLRFRLKQNTCRILSVTGLCGESLTIRCEKRPAPPWPKGGAGRVCSLTRRVASGERTVVSEAERRELAVREKRRTKPIGTGH